MSTSFCSIIPLNFRVKIVSKQYIVLQFLSGLVSHYGYPVFMRNLLSYEYQELLMEIPRRYLFAVEERS